MDDEVIDGGVLMGEQVMPLTRNTTRTKSMPVVADIRQMNTTDNVLRTPDCISDKNEMIRKKAADTAKKLISRSMSR